MNYHIIVNKDIGDIVMDDYMNDYMRNGIDNFAEINMDTYNKNSVNAYIINNMNNYMDNNMDMNMANDMDMANDMSNNMENHMDANMVNGTNNHMGNDMDANMVNNISSYMDNDMDINMLNSMNNYKGNDMDVNMINSMDNNMRDNENIEMFNSFTGIVKEIRHFFDENNNIVENYYFMDVADGDILVTFYLTPETYYADCKIRAGDEVIGFYRTNEPMVLIYPPRYTIRVLARVKEGRNVKADYFNQDLISSDRMLRLNISDETFIINEQGRPFCRSIAGRDLFVIYGASTRSMPAITTPSVVVALS